MAAIHTHRRRRPLAAIATDHEFALLRADLNAMDRRLRELDREIKAVHAEAVRLHLF